jgi:hypothetical protein
MPDFEDVTLNTPDKVKIKGYAIKYRVGPPSFGNGSASGTWEHISKADTMSDGEGGGSGLRNRADKGEKEKDGLKVEKEEDKGPVSDTTVLYLHANAGNMGHRLPIAYIFWKRMKANVFMLSYRGWVPVLVLLVHMHADGRAEFVYAFC